MIIGELAVVHKPLDGNNARHPRKFNCLKLLDTSREGIMK